MSNMISFEQQLFKAADKLRKNIDAVEYKYVVLGLVFIKYISETFNDLYEKLEAEQYSDPEDRDEYLAENVFFVPSNARWSHLHNNAKLSSIGEIIYEAMEV
jgi:type I restriction enzyme M protein